jgi:hypothetical protein
MRPLCVLRPKFPPVGQHCSVSGPKVSKYPSGSTIIHFAGQFPWHFMLKHFGYDSSPPPHYRNSRFRKQAGVVRPWDKNWRNNCTEVSVVRHALNWGDNIRPVVASESKMPKITFGLFNWQRKSFRFRLRKSLDFFSYSLNFEEWFWFVWLSRNLYCRKKRKP